jgi:hypothetical protein
MMRRKMYPVNRGENATRRKDWPPQPGACTRRLISASRAGAANKRLQTRPLPVSSRCTPDRTPTDPDSGLARWRWRHLLSFGIFMDFLKPSRRPASAWLHAPPLALPVHQLIKSPARGLPLPFPGHLQMPARLGLPRAPLAESGPVDYRPAYDTVAVLPPRR